MFLHLSVILFTGAVSARHLLPQAGISQADTLLGKYPHPSGRHHPPPPHRQQMATAADGTHRLPECFLVTHRFRIVLYKTSTQMLGLNEGFFFRFEAVKQPILIDHTVKHVQFSKTEKCKNRKYKILTINYVRTTLCATDVRHVRQISVADIVTGRNEVLAKVIFLHLSVIHSVHGGGGPPDQQTPPGPDPPPTRPPWDQTPRTRHPPGPDTSPPGTRHPPQQTPEYGQRSAGTHPTGMHPC